MNTQQKTDAIEKLVSVLPSWWPMFFYTVLVMAFTWPLMKLLGSHIPGTESDAYVHVWNFNWASQVISSRKFTFHTDQMFFPEGVSLVTHNIAWFNIAVWLLLKPVFGGLPAYTLAILLLLAFNGYAISLLVKDITNSEPASLLAGVIGTTWPYITTQLHHPNLIPIGFVALAVRHMERLIKGGHKRDLVLLAVFVALIGMVRVQLLFMSAFLIAPYGIYLLITSKQFTNLERLGQLVLASVLASVLLTPFAAPVIWHQLTRANPGDLYVHDPGFGSTDLLHYVLPSPFHPLWGASVRKLGSETFEVPFHVPFLGYTVLCLCLLSTIKQKKQALIWGLSAAVLMILALGPALVLGGTRLFTLPHAWIHERILIPILREPSRFNALLSIPAGVLAAIGSQWLAHKLTSTAQKLLLWSMAIILILFEFAIFPFPGLPISIPNWYAVLAQDPEKFGILEIPMDLQHEEVYMLYQLTHGKAMVEGNVARPPREAYEFIRSVPLLDHLERRHSSLPPPEDISISRQLDMLNTAGVRYLILHRNFLTEDEMTAWRKWLVTTPYYEDNQVVVYQTSTANFEKAFASAPSISDKVGLVRAELVPSETNQTGWIQVRAHWFISDTLEKPDATLCIALADDGMNLVQESCDYQVFDVALGDFSESGLLLKHYLVQVQPSVAQGNYQLVFYRPSGVDPVPHEVMVSAGHLTVNALPRTFDALSPSNPVDISYGDEIALVGYDTEYLSESLHITLYWKALRRPSESYKIFVHLIDEKSGALVAQKDYVPRDWQYPTNLWKPGEYVDDRLMIDLSAVPAGTYRLQVGIYHSGSGERLSTIPAFPDNAVPLASVER